jgi:hypothetical protein
VRHAIGRVRHAIGRVRHAIGRVRHAIGRVRHQRPQTMHPVAAYCDTCPHEPCLVLAQPTSSVATRLAVEVARDGTDEPIDDPPALRLATVGQYVPSVLIQ